MTRKNFILSLFAFFVNGLRALPVFANKSSVEIVVPDVVKKGSRISITVKVVHRGNNLLHYTNLIYIKANGIVLKRWSFSITNRPDNENFTKTISYTVTKNTIVEAEASCNLHGSKGKKTAVIKIK